MIKTMLSKLQPCNEYNPRAPPSPGLGFKVMVPITSPLFLLCIFNGSLGCNNLRMGHLSRLKVKVKKVVENCNLVRNINLKHSLVPAYGSRSCKFCRTLITMSIMHCFVSITLIDLRPLCEVKFTFIFIFIYIRLTCLGKKGPCDT